MCFTARLVQMCLSMMAAGPLAKKKNNFGCHVEVISIRRLASKIPRLAECILQSVRKESLKRRRRPGDQLFFVANTRPPDAWLSIVPSRCQPGKRIRRYRTTLYCASFAGKKTISWCVRVEESGQEGWVLSAKGDRRWIECCKAPAELGAKPRCERSRSLRATCHRRKHLIRLLLRKTAPLLTSTRQSVPALGGSASAKTAKQTGSESRVGSSETG